MNVETTNKYVVPLVSTGLLCLGGFTLYKVFQNSQDKVKQARKEAILKLDIDLVPSFMQNTDQQFIDGQEITQKHKNRYAVVYGAGSKAGRAFCKYLVEHGFGLIMADMNYDRMRQTEVYLQDTVKQQIMVKMIAVKGGATPTHESDEQLLDEQIEQALEGMQNFSIDCFVNAVTFDVQESMKSMSKDVAKAYSQTISALYE